MQRRIWLITTRANESAMQPINGDLTAARMQRMLSVAPKPGGSDLWPAHLPDGVKMNKMRPARVAAEWHLPSIHSIVQLHLRLNFARQYSDAGNDACRVEARVWGSDLWPAPFTLVKMRGSYHLGRRDEGRIQCN